VATLMKSGEQGAGDHAVVWDVRDLSGTELANGTYFYRLTVGDIEQSGQMVLAR
jgi:flagellar hook assembly protein FlgD